MTERDPVTYVARPPGVYSGVYLCPVPGCVGSATTRYGLRRHFADRHPMDMVDVPGEGVLPKCELCNMQVNFARAPNHERSATCKRMGERFQQHFNAEIASRALEETFTAYGIELERVEVFKYLGRHLSYADSDAPTICKNLGKARLMWGRLSRVLRKENASAKVSGMFYKATVQAVLLFGSETWVMTPALLRGLEGFHVRAARRMTGMMPRKKYDGSWVYPDSAKVLEAAGMRSIAHYVGVRRAHILQYIAGRPIYELCMEAKRKRGTGRKTFWFEQEMILEEDEASPASATADGALDFQ